MNVDDLLELKSRVKADLMARPGVVGVGVGFKVVGGVLTDQVVIRVHVTEKRDDIPDDQRIPPEIEGVPTDVIQNNFRPYFCVVGGMKIGPGDGSNGTLGIVVRDNTTGAAVGLTNFHVIGAGGTAHDIPFGGAPIGDYIRGAITSTYDATIFAIDSPAEGAMGYVDDGAAPIGWVTGFRAPVLGEAVKKRGTRTGLTSGTVTEVGLHFERGDATFEEQIGVTATSGIMANHGDSGSVFVADSDKKVVGHLHAGGDPFVPGDENSGSAVAIGASMDLVAAGMDITVMAAAGAIMSAAQHVDCDVVVFTDCGEDVWTCPAGVTEIFVECWGAGGGGALGHGGRGGAYANATVTVTPGHAYTYRVGCGDDETAFGIGDDDNDDFPVLALTGGFAQGDVTHTGGPGDFAGGGGGAAAGRTMDGAPGSGAAGGVGADGGGSGASVSGAAAQFPGGGGAGSGPNTAPGIGVLRISWPPP